MPPNDQTSPVTEKPKVAIESSKALPKDDKPLSENTFQLLAKLRHALTDKEFAQVCAKYKQNPTEVVEKINALHSARTIRNGIERAVAFLLELRDDIADKEVANWIKKQRAIKTYAYPFYYGELITKNKEEFKKIADKQLVEELNEFYPVAKDRLIRLSLADLLKEKP